MLRIVERFERHLRQDLVAVAARLLHPARQAVAAGGEGERHFAGQLADRPLRARLAEAETADDDGDARAARAGPRSGVLIHRPRAIETDDRDLAVGRFFQKLLVREGGGAGILADAVRLDDQRACAVAGAGGIFANHIAILGQRFLDTGAGKPLGPTHAVAGLGDLLVGFRLRGGFFAGDGKRGGAQSARRERRPAGKAEEADSRECERNRSAGEPGRSRGSWPCLAVLAERCVNICAQGQSALAGRCGKTRPVWSRAS